jgi:hypothetical protein
MMCRLDALLGGIKELITRIAKVIPWTWQIWDKVKLCRCACDLYLPTNNAKPAHYLYVISFLVFSYPSVCQRTLMHSFQG